jgi:predicted O-linked N-acetylglucosamine transferase (SPINDLY family)
MTKIILNVQINDDKYKKKLIYFFRHFNFEFSDNSNKSFLFKKPYLPFKNFEHKINNIINSNKNYYLSEDKQIIYFHNPNDNQFLNEIIFDDSIDENILHEKYIDIDEDYITLYKIYKEQLVKFYNKNLPTERIKKFINIETPEQQFFNLILYINNKNINLLDELDDIKYYNKRITIFCDNLFYDNEKMVKTKIGLLKRKNIIVNFIFIGGKVKLIPLILDSILLHFEKIIFIKNRIPDLNYINQKTFSKNHFIHNDYIVIDIYTYSHLLIDFDKDYIKIIELFIKNQFKSKYSFIQNKLFNFKDYHNLIKVINDEIKETRNINRLGTLYIKKITCAVLIEDVSILNNEILNVINNISDKDILSEMYLLIENTKFDDIKKNLTIKILSKFENNPKMYFNLLNKFQHFKLNKTEVNELFDTILKVIDKIKESPIQKDKFIINLLRHLYQFHNDDVIINKFNDILNSIFDIKNVKDFNNLILLLNQMDNINDKLVIYNFIMTLGTQFNPYYKDYNSFLTNREIIKKNLEYLEPRINIKFNMTQILNVPVNNFYLSYQGIPSVDIYKIKSKIIRKICPELNYKIDTNYQNKKIKVLFHGFHLNKQHSVFKDRHQIIKHLSLDNNFDIYFSTFDELNNEVKFSFGKAKHIILQNDLYEIKKELIKQKFDIIVYTEIGMYPTSYYMAHMKLAKKQINTWGHSDTCGIDTIDYYFSSELYELEYPLAQLHYSEKLILQKSLCTSYINPIKRHNKNNFKNRNYFGFTDDTIIYFCAQSLFKINPIFDSYIIEILKKVQNSIILLMDQSDKVKIINRFNNAGIGHQIKFIPPMTHFGYMNLIYISDIVLDVYPFGGCNSSMESFSLGKVIVTQPSEMINGRFTCGFYKKMGLNNYICKNKNDYVNLAVKLAKNKGYREKIEKEILEKNNLLFEDKDSICEWKNDLIKILN